MTPRDMDTIITRYRRRILAGDEEAIDGLTAEVRPALIGSIKWSSLGTMPPEVATMLAQLAYLECLLTWQPNREPFVEHYQRRVGERVRDWFSKQDRLVRAIFEIEEVV